MVFINFYSSGESFHHQQLQIIANDILYSSATFSFCQLLPYSPATFHVR
jgi:hypothetical protein